MSRRSRRGSRLDTASVSDALDGLAEPSTWLRSIIPRSPGACAAGPAFTVQYAPLETQRQGFHSAAEYVDDVPPGSIIVSVNPTGLACTTWGDLLTVTAQARGIAGTIVSGFARDVAGVREMKYPLFSAGVAMVSAKNRLRLEAVQIPVVIDGITVTPGDWVVADDNGAIVVRSDRVAIVLAMAESVEETERRIAVAVRGGSPLAAARRSFGYATPWDRASG
ncbi:S-adenosylmethionine--2-demethylmenaquinone methyltransferase [Rathayibacter rathayi]|uniref:Putative 4-hydroxy-4-methyl-2-oxoglutarate aldolase n=1 Tax=Rathayibacter rathayi TaxID=33887 RepID=A0ABD6WCN3_RATRA|nr:RraA family protein [Rathayibacter rathayi]PPF16282.1 S-adenosylmethionine--2-demethylmenaquinone methyltransferase [Rathayibacter rathayi]PPF25553.1 S-adenosylmethionine--2-demethylmenaquinone methyltransferase [Rathayibacter rathayi]PPG16270.1 S-adenosylmethionine--2-demethylmenaquinone methyltransferase [Rathayibacter rathayi]PPG47283.1 S-adenosylmethionine--2-demethylmenaquinone methyltransferase [Rathayibacter rathayi]PPG71932.1 S-adenosylmethionine--2-demethylmenaquinone methyltransfe